jgi:hypothetical protein
MNKVNSSTNSDLLERVKRLETLYMAVTYKCAVTTLARNKKKMLEIMTKNYAEKADLLEQIFRISPEDKNPDVVPGIPRSFIIVQPPVVFLLKAILLGVIY